MGAEHLMSLESIISLNEHTTLNSVSAVTALVIEDRSKGSSTVITQEA